MNASSLLWSVQPPEGKPLRLFGTMHIRDERVYQFCNTLYPLILESDVYVGEMDLDPSDLHYSGPRYDIKDYYKLPAYFKLRKQILKSFKLDIERYAHLHPLMVMSAISHSILEHDHLLSLDEHLWRFAKENQLQLQGLETVQEQLDLLLSIDPVPIYKQIKDIASRPKALRKYTNKALEHYVKGEIHPLYQMTKSSMKKLRKTIIYQRNILMAQRIAAFDPALTYFITVGAGHLSGRYGLISLLKKKGYIIKPLTGQLMA